MHTDLRSRSVRGGAISLLGQVLRTVINILGMVVLARLLTPDDFGVVAMVTAITGFMRMFKDLGLTMATVQREEINHEQVSTLFWVNIGLSFSFMVVTMLIAPIISRLYGDQRLISITFILSSGFLFSGLAVQHQALLRRQMCFSSIAMVEVAALFFSTTFAVLFAWLGAGYWSLVVKNLVLAFSLAVGVWIACGWRPGLPVKGSGVRLMLKFGGHLAVANMLTYIVRNIDKVLLGKYCGSSQLGLYTRSETLLLFPIQQFMSPVSGVANPTLSRLQNDDEKYATYYLKSLSFIAYITMPIVVVLGVLSYEVIGVVFGAQWLSASPIFQIMAFAAFWQPVCRTAQWVFISSGQTILLRNWMIFSAPFIIICILIGLLWGVKGVAVAYSVSTTLLVAPLFLYVKKHSIIKIVGIFDCLSRPVILSVLSGLVMIVVRGNIQHLHKFSIISITIFTGALVFFMASFFWKNSREDIYGFYRIVKSLLPNRK